MFTTFGRTSKPIQGPKPIPGGDWIVKVPVPQTPDPRLLPRFELLSQFVFDDPKLPYGFGLSNMTVVKTTFPGSMGVSRIYAVTTAAGNGSETATTGSKTYAYGLVTGLIHQ